MVVGSGPIRIGQGIEFDYCSVHAARALHEAGVASIMINSNPETVCTDFDASRRLYFEPLDERECPRDPPTRASVQIDDGSAAGDRPVRRPDGDQPGRAADRARDRDHRQLAGVDRHRRGPRTVRGIPRAHWGSPSRPAPRSTRSSMHGTSPSGSATRCWCGRRTCSADGRWKSSTTTEQLARYLRNATSMTPEHPVLVDKYLIGNEVEVDAICDGERRADPRDHGAHRAGRRALRRLASRSIRASTSTRPRSTRSSTTPPASPSDSVRSA